MPLVSGNLRLQVAGRAQKFGFFWEMSTMARFIVTPRTPLVVALVSRLFSQLIRAESGVTSMFWDFGSLHQKPRVGGTFGCVHCDGSDGWRSPVPRSDNTGGRGCLPLLRTIVVGLRQRLPKCSRPCGVPEACCYGSGEHSRCDVAALQLRRRLRVPSLVTSFQSVLTQVGL